MKIHYLIFGLKSKLKQALLIRQPQTYDDAVTFAKRKHHVTDTDSDTQLMDLLQEIRKEVSLKHTGIKQEPYCTPVQSSHTNSFNRRSPTSKQIYKVSRTQSTHPIPNMLHPWIPTLSPCNSSYLKWRKTSNTCSRWNAVMSTSLLLDTTEVSEPLMV